MQEYKMEADRVLKELGSGERGLDNETVRERRKEFGENRLREGKRVTVLQRIFSQMTDPMVLVLIGAAAISAIGAGKEGMADVWIILAVVLLNTVLGVLQESKAEAALQALKEMTPELCRVVREGKTCQIPASELVPGDVVLIEAGDSIPADGRLIEVCSLRVEESALTGEAMPVEKDTLALSADLPPADRKCSVFMGSCAVYGRGKMVVVRTGMETEMGKIASSLSENDSNQTPLQKKLNRLSGTLTAMVLAVCALTFAVGWWKEGEWTLAAALRSFLLAVSLAVAAIPEGMVAVVTIVLSMGVSRMAKRRAIVRKLTAVETLGCTQVICSDKTGTLTGNRMSVKCAWGEEGFLATAMALCNDAEWEEDGKTLGDPTEIALISYAASRGTTQRSLAGAYPRIGEIPFDSKRKCMTTYHRGKNGYLQFTKGAPDVILSRCTAYLGSDGSVRPMSAELRSRALAKNREFAQGALRVMAAAYRIPSSVPVSPQAEREERDLIFIGLVGMMDPVRPEAAEAIATCRAAGIRVVMITGDHPDTARAIAKELGIYEGEASVLTGESLSSMDDDALARVIEGCTVFARVQPEHKTRIVDAWRAKGCVTAMTGDGVNDAPALKHSDIGIGMGICGTDVTKGCADVILADDNFATIVCAVEEGRRIYDNICKAIHFLLSSNLSEVLVVFAATMYGVTVLQPIHLLFINLITDSLPALALGMERAEETVMKRAPRGSEEGIFANGALIDILIQGSLVALLTVAAFFLGGWIESGGEDLLSVIRETMARGGSMTGRTMAFLTMAMAETFHSVNMRSRRGSVLSIKTPNRFLSFAVLSSIAISAALIYFPPLTTLFRLEQIPLPSYLLSLGIASLIIPMVEGIKALWRKRGKSQ